MHKYFALPKVHFEIFSFLYTCTRQKELSGFSTDNILRTDVRCELWSAKKGVDEKTDLEAGLSAEVSPRFHHRRSRFYIAAPVW